MAQDKAAKVRSGIVKAILYIFLVLLGVTCLTPFLIMLVNSTRTGPEIMTSFTLVPSSALQENWKIVIDNLDIGRGFLNSIFISVTATVLSAYFSAMTAYAFAVYKFKGQKYLFGAIMLLLMVPAQLSLLGFYDLINSMHLIDTYVPLIVPAIAHPTSVFFLRQYTKSVMPMAVLEAPRIDGANELVIFHRVALPIMAPGIATMSIGNFIANWNQYLIPLVILNSSKNFTLPLMIGSLRSVQNIITNQGATYLAVAISVLPIIAVFCFCSKYIISSIAEGSVKE